MPDAISCPHIIPIALRQFKSHLSSEERLWLQNKEFFTAGINWVILQNHFIWKKKNTPSRQSRPKGDSSRLLWTSRPGQVEIPYTNPERDLKRFSASGMCSSAEKVMSELPNSQMCQDSSEYSYQRLVSGSTEHTMLQITTFKGKAHRTGGLSTHLQ